MFVWFLLILFEIIRDRLAFKLILFVKRSFRLDYLFDLKNARHFFFSILNPVSVFIHKIVQVLIVGLFRLMLDALLKVCLDILAGDRT